MKFKCPNCEKDILTKKELVLRYAFRSSFNCPNCGAKLKLAYTNTLYYLNLIIIFVVSIPSGFLISEINTSNVIEKVVSLLVITVIAISVFSVIYLIKLEKFIAVIKI